MRPKRRRLRFPNVERESAQQARNGHYPEKVAWIAGENKSTEFTYDIGTEDITTREVSPTDWEPHETLRVTRYSPYLPTRRTVDLPGDYGFTVSSSGLQIVHDSEDSLGTPHQSGGERRRRTADDNSSNQAFRPRSRGQPSQGSDRSEESADAADYSDQSRRDLYERLQPRRSTNRRKPERQGPLGGKPKRQLRARRTSRHWYLRGRER